MGDFDNLNLDEVEARLKTARERLADIEETFNFTLANTNTHLADAMVLEFEQELYEHREIVERLEQIRNKLR